MDTTTGTAAPIMENEHVKELLAIMEANRIPDAKDLMAVIGQISAMENHLVEMVGELAAMRRELHEAQRRNHPVRDSLQKAVITSQGQMLDLRNKLAELKQNIVDGCKNALAAVRDKGFSALRNIAEFFHIRPGLESLRESIDKNIKFDDAAIAKIEAVSAEYHEAGRHLKNMGRALTGNDPAQEAKPAGMLAKSFTAPFRADRACNVSMRRYVGVAIGAARRLEKTERKPPIMETISKLNDQIAQTQKDAPAVERPRPVTRDGR